MDLKNIIRSLILSMDEKNATQIELYSSNLSDYLKKSSDLREDLYLNNEVFDFLRTSKIDELVLVGRQDESRTLHAYLVNQIMLCLSFYRINETNSKTVVKALESIHADIVKFNQPLGLDAQANSSFHLDEGSTDYFWLVVDYMQEHPGKTIGGIILGSLLIAGIVGIALGSCGLGLLGLGALGTLVASATAATSALIGLGFFAVSDDLTPVDLSNAMFLYH